MCMAYNIAIVEGWKSVFCKLSVHSSVFYLFVSPIDIPNFGGHRRSKNSPLTPPDSDGPDSPDGDQGLRELRRINQNSIKCIYFLITAKPAPRQSYAFMAGKPVPSNHKPRLHAEGISELNTKLWEEGLMSGRSLSPICQSRGHPHTLSIWKPRKAKQKPSAKRGTQIQKKTMQIKC